MPRLPASVSVECLLDDHLPHSDDANWYRAPEIPAKKLNNAIGKYGNQVSPANVLALADGTVFGSAKEGILVTADSLYCNTTDGNFSVGWQDIESAKKLGGWPNYGVEVQCKDSTTHIISTTCFDKNQDALVDFLNSAAEICSTSTISQAPLPVSQELLTAHQFEVPTEHVSPTQDSSIDEINTELKLIDVCQHGEFDDVGDLFESAFQIDAECPLLKGYCQYVGFNGREVDAVFLLTNQRLLLFSMEMGAKIVGVELTKRLLGKLPVPFLDTIVCFFLFSIPRTLYMALRGGKPSVIAQALGQKEDQLISTNPPLRKVQDLDLSELAQTVSQVEFGTGVCTGFLDRKFGVSFVPKGFAKTFSLPKDMILPEHETPEPIERLLYTVRSTLTARGLGYQIDTNGQQLTISPIASDNRAAA